LAYKIMASVSIATELINGHYPAAIFRPVVPNAVLDPHRGMSIYVLYV